MRLDGQRLLSGTMVVVFAGFTAMTASYSPDARLAPLVVGALGLALSLAQLAASIRATRRERQSGEGRRGLALMAWFAGFVAGTVLMGIVPAALLLVFAFLRFRCRERWRTALTVAVVFAAVVYAMFELALGIPLFNGVLR